MRLRDKVVVITGAGGGMGRASTLLFAREGARVIATDLNEASGLETRRLAAEAGLSCEFVQGDVTDPADVARVLDVAMSQHGRLDVLFNNAGGGAVGATGDLTKVSDDEVEACIALNLKGPIHGCRAAIPLMIAGGGGVIVSTASITGMRGQNTLGVYGAAKAGVINLTQYVAWEYGPVGIRANAICPGAIQTPALERSMMSNPRTRPVMEYFRHQSPLHRVGRPEDIAETALFLASDASAHITGQAIPVDGGMTCGTFLDPARIRALAEDVLRDGAAPTATDPTATDPAGATS
ncbi:SDR family NAD(P)-dependent oxidoreductase [Pseudofrankia asymbiotica]|uniref:Oxidoreductase n=1 Tax=Pseudofrankia asymbiotica TaxID=1834516 RepID=A0A1V2I7H4_9ACTN|nr:glucose 1-dehydrogenase [Pseudofrankia asymbiotica]ONH27990.1 hypothetical protein BL253_20495 [Pseudofrankia asymbiotica]